MHEQATATVTGDLETTKLALAGLAGQPKQIEARPMKVEQQVEAQTNGD